MQTAKRNLASVTQVPPARFDLRLETTDVDVATGEAATETGNRLVRINLLHYCIGDPYKSNGASQSVSGGTSDLSATSIQD